MNKQCRESLESSDDFNFTTASNQKQFHIAESDDEFIEDINVVVDYLLDGFISIISVNYNFLLFVIIRRSDEQEKNNNVNIKTDEYMTTHLRKGLNQ